MKFRAYLVKSTFDAEKKKQLWLNIAEHYRGNHSLCVHKNYTKEEESIIIPKSAKRMNETQYRLLNNFLNKTIKYVTKVDMRYSTQKNEAFHSMKTHFADKNTAWGKSWSARIALSILKYNEPENYIFILIRMLSLPAFPIALKQMIEKFSKQREYSMAYEKEHSKKKNQHRRRNRKKEKIENKPENTFYQFTQYNSVNVCIHNKIHINNNPNKH